jgi:SAM-dependent methyltransferase
MPKHFKPPPSPLKTEQVLFCPICHRGSGDAKLHHTFHDIYPLVRCQNPSCGTEYLAVRPTAEAMASHYSDPAYYKSDDGIHGYFDYEAEKRAIMTSTRRRLKGLDNTGHAGAQLLEVGGAMGFAALQAQAMGYDTTVVEISDAARQHIEANGLRAVSPNSICNLKDDSFDVAMSWDCLEHVYELEDIISQVHRVLRPGGAFLFNVPDPYSTSARLMGRRWVAYREPEHIIYLNPRAVGLLMGKRFWVTDIRPDSPHMTLGGVALRVGRVLPRWIAPTAGVLTYRILEVLRLHNVAIPIPHGLRLYTAFKKR